MVRTTLVLGLTPLSFVLPISTTPRNPFLLLIFTCAVGGMWRVSRDGDSWGGKCRFFNIYIYIIIFFLPLLHVHTVINELEEGWAGRCFCQPK